MAQVFTSQTANGNSAEVDYAGGEIDIAVAGTFGGASVALEARFPEAGVFVPVSEAGEACVWTEPLVKTLRFSKRCTLRLVVSEASGTTDLDAWI